MTTNHPDPTPPPAEPARSLRPVEEIVPRDVEEVAALVRRVQSLPNAAAELVAREFVVARLAAADRENAELRGDLTYAIADAKRWHDGWQERGRIYDADVTDLRAQLAAAQAQLAEVRAIAGEHWDWKAGQILATRLRAALSAAPQPEPERDARVGDTVTATLRGTLIAYDTDLGKWTLETDGTDHIAWQIELHWAQPFEVVQREPESPASDEPARCSTCGGSFDSPGCCKSPDDDRPRAEAGFHTIDGGPVTSDGPR